MKNAFGKEKIIMAKSDTVNMRMFLFKHEYVKKYLNKVQIGSKNADQMLIPGLDRNI